MKTHEQMIHGIDVAILKDSLEEKSLLDLQKDVKNDEFSEVQLKKSLLCVIGMFIEHKKFTVTTLESQKEFIRFIFQTKTDNLIKVDFLNKD